MSDNSIEYLKLEYAKLNNEISKHTDEIRLRERYAATFAPLAGAWIFVELLNSNQPKCFKMELALTICISTFVIIFLFGMSSYIIYRNIKIAGEYVKSLEEHFITNYKDNKFGWERFYDENNKTGMVRLAVFNWIIYLLLPIVMIGIIVLKYR